MEANLSTIADKTSIWVSRAVKTRREREGLTMRELASKSGISASMISDIERGAKSPTIATLSALARALNVPVAELVDETAQAPGRAHLLRAAEQPSSTDPKSGAKRSGLSPAMAGSKVEFLRYTVPPRAMAGPFAPHASGMIEHMHLASGRVRVVFGADEMELEAGDSCSCLADAPHHFDNRGNEAEALIYIVVERA